MTIAALVDALDAGRFGGKAAQLARSLRAGLPVPDGFAIGADVVHAIVHGDTAALDEASRRAEALGAAAVRSSAVGEDGAGASFAGQHATVLDVRGRAALHAAIECVWASAHGAAARGYRDKLGVAGEVHMAVVVQRLVDADVAGVMFTQDPVNGADLRVIEASWGLGEAVVAGLVTPDHFRLSRQGQVLSRTAGFKDVALRSAPGGGTHEQAVAPERVAALCLSDADLAALQALAGRCETQHGPGPHDIEFAFARGALFLLQCRPVTRVAGR